jgi:FtsP/CotA-like multicopper oxidase with cupredoxin domain
MIIIWWVLGREGTYERATTVLETQRHNGGTTSPALGVDDIEIWELFNFTADAHPIHIHELQFQVVNRQRLKTDDDGITVAPAKLVGRPIRPKRWETGFKDTVSHILVR